MKRQPSVTSHHPGDVFKCCYSTDLRAQQRLRLSVVAAEDLLQAQSEGGGGEGKSGVSKHFGRMFSLQTDGGLLSKRVTPALSVSPAGAEDTDRPKELEEMERSLVVFSLERGEKCTAKWDLC